MVFDTTPVNTGHMTGGCVAVQESLKKHLLWFASRHHISEVLFKHVWDALKIEASTKPEIALFEKFKKNFDKLSHYDIPGLEFPNVDERLVLYYCRFIMAKVYYLA